jgi:L-2-hydroxycarboxylate dehydrogenase (NAD+)
MSLKTRVATEEIVALTRTALQKAGASEEDSTIIIDHVLDGETGGHASHGFFRIPGIVNALRKAGAPNSIGYEDESAEAVLLDGGKHAGLVVALHGVETAIRKAHTSRIVAVGGTNYAGTTGAMGYFTRRLAENDLIGIMLASSGSGVAPWGSREKILGTNPISISIPTAGDPIVADLSTSKMAYGDIALAMIAGTPLPANAVMDKDGNPSTNPTDAHDGSQLTFGDHKGFALSLCFELLAGPLVRAKAGKLAVKGSDGFLILAIRPDIFVSLEQFKANASSLLHEVKNAALRPGFEEILIPGERSQRKRQENRDAAYIDVYTKILDDIRLLAQ